MTDEKIPSIRGLIDSDIGPLRRFYGVLDSCPQETKKYDEGTATERTSVSLSLNFKDLEVVESVEPYNFPIYTITLTISNRKKSRYGVFGVSLASILDQSLTDAQKDPTSPEYIKPSDRPDLSDCIGKRVGMVMADGEEGRPPMHELWDGRAKDETHPKGQDVPTSTWECFSVEGFGSAGGKGVSPLDAAMELLDGKTLPQFNATAMESEIIKSDTTLFTSIGLPASSPKNFATSMVASKQFSKDKSGIYHKVA